MLIGQTPVPIPPVDPAAQTNTYLLIIAISGGLGTLLGVIFKFLTDMRKEKARERQLQESAVITMLKAQVAQLEQKDRDKEEKIGKLQSEAALCQAESAQLRIEVKYLRETVDQLKKENLHLSSPEIIMPPTTEVKKST